MKLSAGQQVLVWEPGKGILKAGDIIRIEDNEYVTLNDKGVYTGPYHIGFVFPDTTPVRNFIKQVEDMKKAMREQELCLHGLIMNLRNMV